MIQNDKLLSCTCARTWHAPQPINMSQTQEKPSEAGQNCAQCSHHQRNHSSTVPRMFVMLGLREVSMQPLGDSALQRCANHVQRGGHEYSESGCYATPSQNVLCPTPQQIRR